MTMKPSDRDIHRLVEKFMNGATTLSEEHELYAYFHGSAVADDLQQMRELFLGLEGLESLDGLGKQQKAEERPKPVASRLRLRPWLTAVAATLLTLIVVSAALYVNHQQNYCEAIVYGQKVTDKTAIRAEMAQTMKAMGIEGDNGIDDQLHDVLMTENNE